MKRTVDISARYQPVIDYYKGYNNAEFNMLASKLLCSYKLLKTEKNLDLLVLIECLMGYSITLPELLVLISEKFETVPQEKIKELEQTNMSKDVAVSDETEKKVRKKRTPTGSTSIPQQSSQTQTQTQPQPQPQFIPVPPQYQQVGVPQYPQNPYFVQPMYQNEAMPVYQGPVATPHTQMVQQMPVQERIPEPDVDEFALSDLGIDLSDGGF